MTSSGIVIVDYGVGNLFSIKQPMVALGENVTISDRPEIIERASKIIFPGVGAFGRAMERLRRHGLVDVIKAKAQTGVPILGICLGMQLLFSSSKESGVYQGLNLVNGEVFSLRDKFTDPRVKIPNIGWEKVYSSEKNDVLLKGLSLNEGNGQHFYFLHSYAVASSEGNTLAKAKFHDMEIAAIIKKGSIYGCQFHPERSGKIGHQLLKNFIAM